jgi:hypothetical protein
MSATEFPPVVQDPTTQDPATLQQLLDTNAVDNVDAELARMSAAGQMDVSPGAIPGVETVPPMPATPEDISGAETMELGGLAVDGLGEPALASNEQVAAPAGNRFDIVKAYLGAAVDPTVLREKWKLASDIYVMGLRLGANALISTVDVIPAGVGDGAKALAMAAMKKILVPDVPTAHLVGAESVELATGGAAPSHLMPTAEQLKVDFLQTWESAQRVRAAAHTARAARGAYAPAA